ncbi:unnamed protein product [Pedinophyceae sp. YPF-701]|nr:unnamed protein product [Pedinophyceae sp. YPF-701]
MPAKHPGVRGASRKDAEHSRRAFARSGARDCRVYRAQGGLVSVQRPRTTHENAHARERASPARPLRAAFHSAGRLDMGAFDDAAPARRMDQRATDGASRVAETVAGPAKRVLGEVSVSAPIDVVWAVLTDYERLPEVVPNLAECRRVRGLPSPGPGMRRLLLRQVGSSVSPFWRLEAGATLELLEQRTKNGGRRIDFKMVDGDFRRFEGSWVLETDPTAAPGLSTRLRYQAVVEPLLTLPSQLVQRVVAAGLPANLVAVARHAEGIAEQNASVPGPAGAAMRDEEALIKGERPRGARRLAQASPRPWESEGGPLQRRRAPAGRVGLNVDEAGGAGSRQVFAPSFYLGTSSVEIPSMPPAPDSVDAAPSSASADEDLSDADADAWGFADSVPSVSGLADASATVPGGRELGRRDLEGAEVHMRRLDDDSNICVRLVAAVPVRADPNRLWATLTDYDALPGVLPNLVSSQALAAQSGRAPSGGHVRLRQVVRKAMSYVQLHGEAIMDVVEVAPGEEVRFRSVKGSPYVVQGKFVIREGNKIGRFLGLAGGPVSVLRCAVEIRIPRSIRSMILEPFLEQTVFEDIPANLCALKRAVEAAAREVKGATVEEGGDAAPDAPPQRATLAEMRGCLHVLERELRREFGGAAAGGAPRMPTRAELRAAGRTDIERALAAHGGSDAVARELGWQTKGRRRKPPGYWDDLENVRAEIEGFVRLYELEEGCMPPKTAFLNHGRYDIARAIEKWGGVQEVASALGLGTASSRRSGSSSAWNKHVRSVAAETGLSGQNGLFQVAAASYDSLSSLDLDDEVERSFAAQEVIGEAVEEDEEEECDREVARRVAAAKLSQQAVNGAHRRGVPQRRAPSGAPPGRRSASSKRIDWRKDLRGI